MAYKFRLEQMLKIVKEEKETLERSYQDIYHALEEIAHRLMELMQEKERAQTQLLQKISRPVRIDALKLDLFDVEQFDQRMVILTADYARTKQTLEKLKPQLLEKAIELKKYEKMEEIGRKNYQTLEKKRMTKHMDAIAAARVKDYG
ncbi:MAG: flagellar export protein FliJ [Sporolactobacillus sp.]